MNQRRDIYLFDTYERLKRKFKPLSANTVCVYSCGPTVYDYPHIGNLRAYVFVDTLRRMLEMNDYKVQHVINITDVGHLTDDADEGEDKVEQQARVQQRSVQELATYYTDVFIQNLQQLNIKLPQVFCKASEHITEQIELIRRLEDGGYAYRTSDGLYFDTAKSNHYGHLARLDQNKEQSRERVKINLEKRQPMDFALWKLSPPDVQRQMEWASPWGKGFPGWHIECSAMAMKYLGETFDIHTGGVDHIPVHHTNEIAQSEVATGKKLAQYWLHVAFLMVDGAKMSKSKRNFYTIEQIERRGFEAIAFRYLLLTAKYRASINFTWESLSGAQKALDTLRGRACSWDVDDDAQPDASLVDEFYCAINDDLNMPRALAVLWKTVDAKVATAVKRKTVALFDRVLGLSILIIDETAMVEAPVAIKDLLARRDALRQQKKWVEADKIRSELELRGYSLRDTNNGTSLK